MSDSEPEKPDTREADAIDHLMAEHVQRRAGKMDVGSLVTRIRLSRDIEGALPPALSHCSSDSVTALGSVAEPASLQTHSRGWLAVASWPMLTALALLIAFFVGRLWGPLTANASAALRDLQTMHLSDIDRCYRVQYAPDPRSWDKSNRLEGPSSSILWTRGDRFWSDCMLADLRLKIGRAEDGSLWIAPSPEKGIQFSNQTTNLPQEVSLLCEVNAMTVPRLVDEVLADFELRIDRSQSASKPLRTVIWATLKPGHTHSLIESALLEIDSETGTMMGLVLSLVRNGQPRGTVTYTFLEAAEQDDALYDLRTHLNQDAQLETHS